MSETNETIESTDEIQIYQNTRARTKRNSPKSPPKNYDDATWKKYLGRQLRTDERDLLNDCRSEKNMNKSLLQLHKIIHPKNMAIGCLTGLYGNCLFESLQYYGICGDVKEFRNTLANIMYHYKSYKNFFANQEETLEELFNISNVDDIGNVLGSDNKVYKYTYDVMILDLTNNYSWTRLPTHLIIMVISRIYNLRINIYSNMSEHVNVICMGNNKSDDIYLGHLDNSHYIALCPINRLAENDKPLKLHVDAQKRFFEWRDRLINPSNEQIIEQPVEDFNLQINQTREQKNQILEQNEKTIA